MQRFAVIGLGRFGSRLAMNLAGAGQEVVAIDTNARIVEEMRDRVTLAVALNATDEEALKMQGIHKVDVAVVAIGNDFEANCLSTVVLKQIGVKRVVARALSPASARVLASIGADAVVNPENESADRWATRLVSPQFLNYFDLGPGAAIVEVRTPQAWVGRKLTDLRLRNEMGLYVVGLLKPAPAAAAGNQPIMEVPNPDLPLEAQDRLLILGPESGLAKLPG